MRVVAGSARGRRLVAPKGLDVRPTPDRVREALFNILGDRVVDAVVLDLYSGTGAVSVEALSRGAARAVLVDDAPAAIAAANENLERLGMSDRARVVRSTVERFLDREPADPADLVFLDPPYGASLHSVDEVVRRVADQGFLAPSGVVVVERPAAEIPPSHLGPLPVTDSRRYGTTRLLFA